jgi:acetyl-CoA carboxylase/biotin carboxylase 1
MKCAWVCPQNTKPADRSPLSAQCEPLLAVAEAHAEGKEAFARSIATELFSDFLSVEERFAANKEATEQEVIDQLRQVILHIVLLPATQASLFYTY